MPVIEMKANVPVSAEQKGALSKGFVKAFADAGEPEVSKNLLVEIEGDKWIDFRGDSEKPSALVTIRPGAMTPQKDYAAIVAQAREEQSQNFRPALKASVDDLDDYDVIFVGYPNWWGDLPMIMYSFFEQHDFSGKIIIPFNTHGGSGFSGTVSTIAGLQSNATVSQNGKSISRNSIQDARQEIVDWVTGLGYSK